MRNKPRRERAMDRNVGIARRLLMGGQEARHVAYSHEPVITSNATAPGGTIQWAPRRLAQNAGAPGIPGAGRSGGTPVQGQAASAEMPPLCHDSWEPITLNKRSNQYDRLRWIGLTKTSEFSSRILAIQFTYMIHHVFARHRDFSSLNLRGPAGPLGIRNPLVPGDHKLMIA